MNNKVRELRIKKGLSQEELASLANLSRFTIIKVENDRDVNLTKNAMVAIANALGDKVSNIFFF